MLYRPRRQHRSQRSSHWPEETEYNKRISEEPEDLSLSIKKKPWDFISHIFLIKKLDGILGKDRGLREILIIFNHVIILPRGAI